MKILIDNGHGIDTPGKRSPDGVLREYAWNRLIASRIVDRLLSLGLDAELLVPEETDISLAERCRRVNAWCRQLGKNNVIVISIHANAAGHGDRWYDATGWCAYTSRGNTRADALATSLYHAAQAYLPGHRLRTTPTAIRTWKQIITSYAIPRPPPSSPKTSSWTPTPTTPSSSAKKVRRPLSISMLMVSATTILYYSS